MPLRYLFIELEEYEVELNRLDKNEERHMKKKKKDSGSAVVSSRKDDEEVDSDDEEEMNLVIKDLFKLLKKNKKSFKQGEKERQKRGSSSTRAMP